MAVKTLPVTKIAQLFLLTPRHVQRLTNEGVIPRAARGQYEFIPSLHGYIRYLRDRAIGADALPDESARANRARLIKAQAEAQEMENAKVRGELLPREQVRVALSMVFGVIRNRILAIDKKLPMRVIGCNSLKEIQGFSTEMHHEALSELANFDLDRIAQPSNSPDDPGSTTGADAAPEVEGQRMGGPVPEAVPRVQRGARAVVHE